MNYEARRERLFSQMADNSLLILYSGIALHRSADAYYHFETNHNFFYLTGLSSEKMILIMKKIGTTNLTILYIEESDPAMERWTGKMVTIPEAKQISGIADIHYIAKFNREQNVLLNTADLQACYFDCYRNSQDDIPDYNLLQAQRFAADYPGIPVRNVWPILAAMRMQKDKGEIDEISKAIAFTKNGLESVMANLAPGMREFQAQAQYEFSIRYAGSEGPSFPTIAGSGKNGCMLHYETNQGTCEEGSLLLLDLGAKSNGYCSDITRTYPVSGQFSDRQRKVYDIVLQANRKIAETAKPGMTTKELNEICKEVLAHGCISLGLIQEPSEITKYYMHGVSHHLGIDVHDVTIPDEVLTPGSVITDEPGLYIDEWEIGIRIEDDLLITEDGCVVLSEDVLRDADAIEAFMRKAK